MIGIIGAMEQEVSQIVAAMTDVAVSEIAGMKFNKGKFCNKEAKYKERYCKAKIVS